MRERKRQFKIIGFIILLSIALFFPFFQNSPNVFRDEKRDTDLIETSAQRSVTTEWLKNNNFSTQDYWVWENGTEGDNSDVNAAISSDQANYEVLGETRSYSGISGVVNSSTSPGWGIFNNSGYLPPHTAEINTDGCNVAHHWDETAGGDSQIYNYPSIQFKKNVSLGVDTSDYVIKSASLEVIFNASVDSNIDTPNDEYVAPGEDLYAIGDFATFYVLISDLNNDQSYTIAYNRTKYLGQYGNGNPSILNITDSPMYVFSQDDIITALNAALDKDLDHSNFTITLGIDIYSEDNDNAGDHDDWDSLMIKTCNLTFTYEKKIDQSTTLSWNQEGNTLDSASVQVTDAKFFFKYKLNNTWPTTAPLSEIIFYINDKKFDEGIIKLTTANTSWQDAKVEGFDVTSLISTDVNITVSIEVFIKDTFELGQVYSISIDDVYLNISYIENFPDYGTDLELFLDGEDKTLDPVIQIPIKNMLNINVTYKENVSGNHISADSATLEGKISGDLTENSTFEYYSFIVNTTDLGLGISVLTVTLMKTNYETEFVQIFVEVIERETELQLLVEDIQRSNNETINVKFNEFLNFTVFYEDNLTTTFIEGASVELLGFGSMNETLNQYNFTLNINDLSQGVNILTVFAQKNNYESNTIQIYINVAERASKIELFVNFTQTYDSDSINSQFSEFLNLTIHYRDNLTNQLINGASVSLLGFGALNETPNHYYFILDTNNLSQGVNILTLYAQKDNYQYQAIKLFVNIQVRTTFIKVFVENVEKNNSDTINTQFGEQLNITILYRDNGTNAHLNGASVDLVGIGSFSEIGTQFSFTIITNDLVSGLNILTIFAQLNGFQDQTFQILLDIFDRETELLLFIDSFQKFDSETINSQHDEFLNITVLYRDNVTKQHITNTTANLLGLGVLNEVSNQYNFTLSTNDLSQGINVLTILCTKDNFQSQTIQFVINIQERATYIRLFIDGTEIFDSDTFDSPFDEYLNITLLYRDFTTDAHLTGANVDLLGIGNLTESGTQFYLSLDTNNLVEGINALTIISIKDNYQSKTIQFFINVQERATYIRLFVEDIEKFDLDTIDTQFDEFLNITILYRDFATNAHLAGAKVDLLGIGNFTEIGTQFNFTLDTDDLVEGINALTIISIKDNYQSKSIQFFINVQERATYMRLFIEDIERFHLDTIDTQFNELLNITILYRDSIRDIPLTGANVDLLGIGNFTEIGSQFNYTIDTNTLENDINILTVFAQYEGYKPQRIQFFINVEERNTRLSLYINNLPKSQGESVKVEANELINITVYYEDYLTNISLNAANIELLGFGVLTQVGMYYNTTLNSNSLEKGVNVLTIFAQLSNYQARSVQFLIEVVDRATHLQLLLNGEDKTLDPVFELPIESIVNITVKYLDNQTGLGISSALLQLIGENLYQNFTENVLHNQYTIILNTSTLLIGVKLFTIVASSTNFQINTIDLRISVNRLSTSIDTASGLNFVDINPSENFLIQIVLNNTVSGGLIKNATVTYIWDNGQGILTDLNNDGIYEAILTNVPAGSYLIRIYAYAGENYDFRDDFEIVLNVIAPPGPDITIILISLAAGVVGLSVIFVLYQTRFKYPPKVRMMRKLRKKIGKGKKLKPLTVNTRDNIITTETERNKEVLSIEKESVDKLNKKTGGESLE